MQTTSDIVIEVNTQFIGQHTGDNVIRYAFSYHVTMTNIGLEPLQLRNRYWLITDGNGDTQEVSGAGVVGEEPIITPDESFEYHSGAVLDTPVGSMQGHYEFESKDGTLFKAPINVFSLAVANALN
ncbi:MAG TPA: Co2+/Mg2+ efflux protein ApaG [Glaciecola sp.]|nr:Co2+/Mg2+ efflux protein ApaG [Glaciecola sp.]